MRKTFYLSLEKKDIALKQLRAAAKHYNARDYICSITLAGAAEEILGQLAKKRRKTNQLIQEIEYLKGVYNYFTGKKPTNQELIKKINKIKNELKHNESGNNEWINGDFEYEAAIIFVKAVKNYFDSYDEFPKDRIINNLFDFLTL